MTSRAHNGRLRRASGRGALMLTLAFVTAGCAATTERLARQAVPGALEGMTDFVEEDRQRLERLLSSPEIQAATRSLVAAVAGGVLDGLTEEQRVQRLQAVSADYIAAVTKALSKSMKEEIGPGVTAAAQQAVEGVLASALSPTNRRNAAALADAVTHSAVTAVMESGSKGLREDLGPALSEVMDEDLGPALERMIAVHLGPALRDAMGDSLTPEVGALSREVSKQMALGAVDGFRELQMKKKVEGATDSFWTRLDATLHKGIGIGAIAASILGLLVIGLGVWVGRSIHVRRRLEEEHRETERRLLGVIRGMQGQRDKPEVEAMLAELIKKDPELGDERYFAAVAAQMAKPSWKPSDKRTRAA